MDSNYFKFDNTIIYYLKSCANNSFDKLNFEYKRIMHFKQKKFIKFVCLLVNNYSKHLELNDLISNYSLMSGIQTKILFYYRF